MNFVRLDPETCVVGVVVTDLPSRTQKQRRQARRYPSSCIKTADLRRVVSATTDVDRGVVADFEKDRDEYFRRALRSPELISQLVTGLREELQQNRNQSHDFLQLIKLIRGFAAALLEERMPGVETVEAAERLASEGSIFFATELLLAKVDATIFLTEPNMAFGQERQFSVHGFATKYFKIYRWQAEQKELNLQMTGTSQALVRYRPEAVGAVIHALLDNLVKYAPSGSSGSIDFLETATSVRVEFTSLGPRVEASEMNLIFTPGFRAKAARSIESSGLGFGLAAAKRVSDMIDLDLKVNQDPVPTDAAGRYFKTRFSFRLARAT